MSDRSGERQNLDPNNQAKHKDAWPVRVALAAIAVAIVSLAIANQNRPSSPPSVITGSR